MKNFRQVLEGVDTINENLAKETKALAKEISDAAKRESGGDKKDFLAISKLLTQNKLKDAAKYMAKLDTVVLEDLVTFVMGHESVFKAMYPKARPGQFVASFARKVESVEGVEEETIEEAMSEKDKAKRLKLIKQAVEKMNKSNMERAKKDALKMMKDSGMFDEELEEAKPPKIKGLSMYGSEISGLKRSNGSRMGTYTAKPVIQRGKLAYRVTDEFGSFETLDLKTFAKVYG
jgi:hypothetical protein